MNLKSEVSHFRFTTAQIVPVIIDIKKANMDLVRAGISIYGLYPSEEVEKKNVPLRPAMELISHVSYVKTVPEGTPVSYGGTYVNRKRDFSCDHSGRLRRWISQKSF